jgi:hypothetical protein
MKSKGKNRRGFLNVFYSRQSRRFPEVVSDTDLLGHRHLKSYMGMTIQKQINERERPVHSTELPLSRQVIPSLWGRLTYSVERTTLLLTCTCMGFSSGKSYWNILDETELTNSWDEQEGSMRLPSHVTQAVHLRVPDASTYPLNPRVY